MLVDVVLPLAMPGPLTYRLPTSLESRTRPGVRLLVPLGSRKKIGCLLGESRRPHPGQIKEVLEILDDNPLLGPSQLRLLTWASSYYLTPIGEILRHLLPPRFFRFAKGSRRKPRPPKTEEPFPPAEPFPLTAPQEESVRRISQALATGRPESILLHGITGSGKTEVYIEVARRVLRAGGQVLVLVPEIALTPQLVGRFQSGLSLSPVPYHSGLTEAQRATVWEECRSGINRLVIGTRSAIFLPFPSLRLLIVDEEHDPSYKQEERFCYNARDLALWRGREEKAVVLLGSATPSLETIARVREGKATLLNLSSRPAGAVLPTVRIIDRKREESKTILSPELVDAIHGTLKRGEQTLLFLNRRGYSPFLLCPRCGFIPRCPGCEISLTYHQRDTRLLCHYCDAETPVPEACRRCGGLLNPSGVGTERVEREIEKLFPKARIGRLDRDAGRGGRWLKVLSGFRKREIDILIGTQMVTKGHDYPHLTLVGILDADVSLNLPDFRAAERTFQILTQVSGRAGRSDRPGEVIVQTFHPEHSGILAAARHDGTLFYEQELRHRREAGYPPFTRLIQIRLTGPQQKEVVASARRLAEGLRHSLPEALGKVLGPAPCLIEKIRGKSRWHLLIKTGHYARLQPILHRLLNETGARNLPPSGIRRLINVDPVDIG